MLFCFTVNSKDTHPPSGMAVQLVEDRVVAVLEHEVELPFAPEHLDQIHQVGVFQLLQRNKEKEKYSLIKTSSPAHPFRGLNHLRLVLSKQTKLLTAGNKHAVAPDNLSPSRPIYERWCPAGHQHSHPPHD